MIALTESGGGHSRATQDRRDHRRSVRNVPAHRDGRGDGSSAPPPPRRTPQHNRNTTAYRVANVWTPNGPAGGEPPPLASATPAPATGKARTDNRSAAAATPLSQELASVVRQPVAAPHEQRHSTLTICRPRVSLAQVRAAAPPMGGATQHHPAQPASQPAVAALSATQPQRHPSSNRDTCRGLASVFLRSHRISRLLEFTCF